MILLQTYGEVSEITPRNKISLAVAGGNTSFETFQVEFWWGYGYEQTNVKGKHLTPECHKNIAMLINYQIMRFFLSFFCSELFTYDHYCTLR